MSTTPKLTHEQAELLRAIRADRIDCLQTEDVALAHSMVDCIEEGALAIDKGRFMVLSDAGRKALAAYDAELVVVRREILVRSAELLDKQIAYWQGEDVDTEREALAELKAALNGGAKMSTTIVVNGEALEAMPFDGDFLIRASAPGECLWLVTRAGHLIDDTLWERVDMESSEYFAKWLAPAFDHFWPEGR